ncbi:MAG: acyl-CoA dehydrogenase family protein [Ktedonobacterales bacterium]
MIDFEIPETISQQLQVLELVALQVMRPSARYYDEHEHERPWEYIKLMWEGGNNAGFRGRGSSQVEGSPPPARNVALAHAVEMLSYGDCGLYLSTPGGALGAAAIEASGTPEQRSRFLARFLSGEPKWGAMAMTEPHAGSDTANIRTTARLSEDRSEWILNGEKIFVTNGLMAAQESTGLVVVWATVAPGTGRRGMKSFVVEANTPGMKVEKLEKKHGIRASDTAAISFNDCHIPYDNILGSPDVGTKESRGSKGFQGAMKTFDATRPLVAASAIGVGRAALDYTKEYLARHDLEVRYGAPYAQLLAVERDIMRMEIQLRSAWLLTLRAAWQIDQGITKEMDTTVHVGGLDQSLAASMCKVKAGEAVTFVTQKAVEILGHEGYSCKNLVEKWMRDAKINDLYEGTGQINRLIVARRMLGYSRDELA